MAVKLLQIKVDLSLKDKLQRIALSKGLNVTSYIKMTLIEASVRDEEEALTENGFTVREEKRLSKSLAAAKKLSKQGELKTFASIDKALESLDE